MGPSSCLLAVLLALGVANGQQRNDHRFRPTSSSSTQEPLDSVTLFGYTVPPGSYNGGNQGEVLNPKPLDLSEVQAAGIKFTDTTRRTSTATSPQTWSATPPTLRTTKDFNFMIHKPGYAWQRPSALQQAPKNSRRLQTTPLPPQTSGKGGAFYKSPPPRCNCSATQAASPVCGTDNSTYQNIQLLRCFSKCGHRVKFDHDGPC